MRRRAAALVARSRGAAVLAAIVLAGCGGGGGERRPAAATTTPASTPTPTAAATPAPLPRDPAGLARDLTAADAALRAAIDHWKPKTARPPAAVTKPAARQQALLRRLTRRPRLARATIARLSGRVQADARDIVTGQRALRTLNAPFAKAHRKLRIEAPEPAATLLAHYREAKRRSSVGVPLLAAVNLVESAFGRVRNDSVAGAQGPMQFIPATWRTYGRGGNIQDPRDAILAAARFLHAAGAPADPAAALQRYNPSPLYVAAVLGYARVIRRDLRGFYGLYAWPAPVP